MTAPLGSCSSSGVLGVVVLLFAGTAWADGECSTVPATHETTTFALTVDPLAIGLRTGTQGNWTPGARFETNFPTHARWNPGLYLQARTNQHAFGRDGEAFLSVGVLATRLLFHQRPERRWDPEAKDWACRTGDFAGGPFVQLSLGPYGLKTPREDWDRGVSASVFVGWRAAGGDTRFALPFGLFIEPSKSFDDARRFQIVFGVRLDLLIVPVLPFLYGGTSHL